MHCRRTADVSGAEGFLRVVLPKLNLSSGLEIPLGPGMDLAIVLAGWALLKEVT